MTLRCRALQAAEAAGEPGMAEGHQGPPPPVPDLTEEDLRILVKGWWVWGLERGNGGGDGAGNCNC